MDFNYPHSPVMQIICPLLSLDAASLPYMMIFLSMLDDFGLVQKVDELPRCGYVLDCS